MEAKRLFAIRRKLSMNMVWVGAVVGLAAGLVVSAGRLAIQTLGHAVETGLRTGWPGGWIGWLVTFLCAGWLAGRLVQWEPMSTGSGIPQVSAEVSGRIHTRWYKVLPAKWIGGILSLGFGLTLGREGPSIQMGAATGQMVGDVLRRPEAEKRFILSSGAAAGLAAAFNAPLAGIVFALEEIHRNTSSVALIGAMVASITADFVCVRIFGLQPVLSFPGMETLPLLYYGWLPVLGVVTGLSGVLFTKGIHGTKKWYAAWRVPVWVKTSFAFALTALLLLRAPQLFGSGEELIYFAGENQWGALAALATFGMKLALVWICFGSGLPGGIFFPLLVLGYFLGHIGGTVIADIGWLPAVFVLNFGVLAMAGHLTAIVRAPLTAMVLIAEMSGSFRMMLPIGVVALFAYLTAEALRCAPIYETLQERMLKDAPEVTTAWKPTRERTLAEFCVEYGSRLDGKKIRDIPWPDNFLLVAVKRGEKEIIPSGRVELHGGDYLIALLHQDDRLRVTAAMEAWTKTED